jgi:protein-S-isoprenylcysteine O-methyltransferase Ste14
MKAKTRTTPERARDPALRRRIARSLIKSLLFMLIVGAALFLSAGTLDWPMAWLYLAAIAASTVAAVLLMDPELIAERGEIGEGTRAWDILLALIMGRLVYLAIAIVAGLDKRFAWSPPLSLPLQVAALLFFVLALAWTDWAVVANRFFSGVVRIQHEREHKVVSRGPYRYVRHPGYLGSLVATLASPLVLGSLWALVPAGLTAVAIVVRTAMEDRVLQQELPGYRRYTRRVRYRLLPGVW